MTLEALRDELAPEYTGETCSSTRRSGWFGGWDAAIKALSESAGEFRGELAAQEFWNRGPSDMADDRHSFEEGARWQFEQDRARVGLAIKEGHRIAEEAMSCREIYWKDKAEQLEARIQESEASVKRIDEQLLFRVNQVDELEDKLHAAEAKVRDLQHKLHAATAANARVSE